MFKLGLSQTQKPAEATIIVSEVMIGQHTGTDCAGDLVKILGFD